MRKEIHLQFFFFSSIQKVTTWRRKQNFIVKEFLCAGIHLRISFTSNCLSYRKSVLPPPSSAVGHLTVNGRGQRKFLPSSLIRGEYKMLVTVGIYKVFTATAAV